jgi:hypothetical protein
MKIENFRSDAGKEDRAADAGRLSVDTPAKPRVPRRADDLSRSGRKLRKPFRQFFWRHTSSGNLQFAICNSQFATQAGEHFAIAAKLDLFTMRFQTQGLKNSRVLESQNALQTGQVLQTAHGARGPFNWQARGLPHGLRPSLARFLESQNAL